MGRVLYDGLVEYDDGTPATSSQMAKDVSTFLNWAAEPELDDRHKIGLQSCAILSAMWVISIWVKRYKWAPIKTRKIREYTFILLNRARRETNPPLFLPSLSVYNPPKNLGH